MGTCESRLRRAFFLQIVGFQEIFVYQEYFCVLTLLASSSNHNDDEGSMKIKPGNSFNKKNKNSDRASILLADFFSIIVRLTLSSTIRMAMG